MAAALALCTSLSVVTVAAAATTVAAAGDASIVHDQTAGTWALAAGSTTLTLALDATRDFAIGGLTTTAGQSWTSAIQSDSVINVNGRTLALGSRSAGFSLQDVQVESGDNRLQLDATWTLAEAGLRVTRHYAIVSGSPTFETWTSYTATGAAVVLADLNALRILIPAGTMHWINGLRGDNADVDSASAFTLQAQTLDPGGHFSIGANGRSSEQSVPWVAVDGGALGEFYAALMWSGAWSLTADRSGSTLAMNIGLATMSTTLSTATASENGRPTVDGPHVVFGVTSGALSQATAALRSYVLDGIRAGRPLTPLVTYNTWFAYGTEIDEPTMEAEMKHAAALGSELFVIDAGWYGGTGVSGPFDFDAGLGNWTPDAVRFPNGLGPLRDYAHGLGMKFGLWVEPERVNLSQVGAPGVDEQWLATAGGQYGSDHAAQICLANDAARRWIQDQLTSLLDQVQPDYLKWDNNMWVNCDRSGHDHGASDGNFGHVSALYSILATIRGQYPGMLIENVSGGGNRLDLGMMRYTDAAWMDDRTAPSVNVRRNVEGLSALFPPAYLLSFVTDHDTEPLHDSPDLSLYMRSRMAGALGLCFRGAELSDGDAASLSHEIDIYKALRPTLSVAAGTLLTAQASADGGPAWDVLQETASGNGQAVVHAVQTNDGVGQFNVKPTGLTPGATYTVTSVDTGVLGEATGADLMSKGIDVLQSPTSAAHILIIRQQ